MDMQWASIEGWRWFIDQCVAEGREFELSVECGIRELPPKDGWAVFEDAGARKVTVKLGGR